MAAGPGSSGPNSANIEFVRATIKHAQISSAISKQLTSAKAMRDSLEITMAHVQALEKRLDDWRNSLHPEFVSSPPFFDRSDRPRRQGTQTSHILFLHFCYHSSVIAIHGVFSYPWNRPDLQQYQQQQKQQKQDGHDLHISSPQLHAQIERSTKAVAESSRQIILAVQSLEITSAMPLWLTLFSPLVGMINLFVYILKNPLAPSLASDLSLLDVVVGHFGYLQFISSSEHVFPFPREIAAYARHAVEVAAAEKARRSSTTGAAEKHQQRQKQSRHSLFQRQQNNQQIPQVIPDGGLYGGFINSQDMLLQQMVNFPTEVSIHDHGSFPNLTNAGVFGLVWIIEFVADFVIENAAIRLTHAYGFAKTYGPLTLFPGEVHQFPIYESVFVASLGVLHTAMRMKWVDNGVSPVERGYEA